MQLATFWHELWQENGDIVYRQGGYRTDPVEATLSRIDPLLSRAGIVRLTELTGLDHVGLPVVMAVRPTGTIESVSYGKGADLQQARVGAAMECLERWHAENVELPVSTSTYGQIKAHLGYDLFRLTVSDPCFISEQTPIQWFPAVFARSGQPTQVPAELVHLDFRVDRRLDLPRFRPNTNGLASANTVQEALLHALCEIVERDALALHQAGLLHERAIRLTTIPPGQVRELAEGFQQKGFSLLLSELPSPTGVPTMMTQIWFPDDQSLFMGSGSHPDRDVAAIRSLTEAAQTRLCRIAGISESLNSDEDTRWPDKPDWTALEQSDWDAGQRMDCCGTLKTITDRVLKRIEETTGEAVIVVDLRHSAMEHLPVVFAFAPGMRYVEA